MQARPQLAPVVRTSVPDAVAAQLADQILEGALTAGDDLPGERALADALGVSRPTIREAMRQLAQRGLVEIRQGGATTVADYRRTAGLDLLPHLLRSGGGLDVRLVVDVMRARSAIAPQIARAAAVATPRADGGAVATAAIAPAAAAVAEAAGPVAQQHAALAFWDAVVDRSGSMVFRLLYNGLRRAYEPAIEALAPLLAEEVGGGDRYTALAAAIDGGRGDVAEARAAALLAVGRDAVCRAVEGLAPDPPPTGAATR